MLKIWE